MSIVYGKCKYIQKKQASLIYTYDLSLHGYIIVGVFIGKSTEDKLAFLDLWKHFITTIAKSKRVYGVVYDNFIESHAFKNQMTYHSTINGLFIYEINNFVLDNPDLFPDILTKDI
jgi:hypothetical protein